MKPVINTNLCFKQKRSCEAMPACPKYAISWVEDDYSETGVRIVIDYDLCDGCGLCVDACCGDAIELV